MLIQAGFSALIEMENAFYYGITVLLLFISLKIYYQKLIILKYFHSRLAKLAVFFPFSSCNLPEHSEYAQWTASGRFRVSRGIGGGFSWLLEKGIEREVCYQKSCIPCIKKKKSLHIYLLERERLRLQFC